MSVSFASSVRAVMAAGALLLSVDPAVARRVAVDSPWPMPSAGYCLLNGAFENADCNAVTLGFAIGNAGVSHSKIYIYDDGLVSLGAPVANGNALFPEGFGPPVIISGLSRIVFDPTGSGDPLTPVFARIDTSNSSRIVIDWFTGEVVFNGGTEEGPDGFPVLIPGSFAEIRPERVYPDPNEPDQYYELYRQRLTLEALSNGRTRALVEYIPTDVDFPFEPYAGVSDVGNVEDNYPTSFSFEFGALVAGPGVPEAGTWAMMIAGFGLVGGMMRRRRVEVTPGR